MVRIGLKSLSKGTKYDCSRGKFYFARFVHKSGHVTLMIFDIAIIFEKDCH